MKTRTETKAAQILRLYALGTLSIREIGEIVGCRPEYVRVVARQRNGGPSNADLTYLDKALQVSNFDEFNAAGRKEYRRQRLLGASADEASRAAHRARTRAIVSAAQRSEPAHA